MRPTCDSCKRQPKWLSDGDLWEEHFSLHAVNTTWNERVTKYKLLSKDCAECFTSGRRAIKVMLMVLAKLGLKKV